MRSFIFIGAPGVGKGTFAKEICRRNPSSFFHFSLGDEMRKEIKSQTELGAKLKSYVEGGQLVPDHVSMEFAFKCIESINKNQNIILDGFPRNLAQARALKAHFTASQEREFLPINIHQDLDVSLRKMLGRMVCENCLVGFNNEHIVGNGYDMPALMPDPKNCSMASKFPNPEALKNGRTECLPKLIKRGDDTREIIMSRFLEYEEKTAPLLAFFSDTESVKNEKWLKLRTFEVRKGIADTDSLLEMMKS